MSAGRPRRLRVTASPLARDDPPDVATITSLVVKNNLLVVDLSFITEGGGPCRPPPPPRTPAERPAPPSRSEPDDEVWTVGTEAGRVPARPGGPARADASPRADPRTLNGLLETPDVLDAAICDGSAAAAGDLPALGRLLRAASSPSPAQADS